MVIKVEVTLGQLVEIIPEVLIHVEEGQQEPDMWFVTVVIFQGIAEHVGGSGDKSGQGDVDCSVDKKEVFDSLFRGIRDG